MDCNTFEEIKLRVQRAQLQEAFERAGAFPEILVEKDTQLVADHSYDQSARR